MPVEAIPDPPMVLFGMVTVDGDPVPEGTLIEARIADVHYGQDTDESTQITVTHAETNGWNFGHLTNFQVCGDDIQTSAKKEGGTTGNPIVFFVNGIQATVTVNGISGASLPFASGSNDNIPIFIDVPAPLAAPSSDPQTSDDSCTTQEELSVPGATATPTATPVPPTATPTPSPTAAPTATTGSGGGGGGGGGGPAPVRPEPTPKPAATAGPEAPAVDIDAVVDTIGFVNDSQAADIIEDLEADVAAAVVEQLAPEKAAGVMENLSDAKAVEVVEKLDSTKAAEVLEGVETGKAAKVIDGVTVDKAAEIVENLSANKAAGVMDNVTAEKAVSIIERVSTAAAAAVMEMVSTGRAAEIITQAGLDKAAGILTQVSSVKAGSILNETTTARVTALVGAMPVETLTQHLPEMSPEKLFEVEPGVLFSRLPKVTADHLVFEDPPDADPNLPPPLVAQVTPTLSIYTVPQTGELRWVKLIGSPTFIDQVLGKFNRELSDVSINVEELAQKPADVSDLGPGRIAYEFFTVEMENAAPEDVTAIHAGLLVSKSWMQANSIHKWSLQLERYDEQLGEWVAYPARRAGEDENNLLYTAAIPGFSLFAITGSVDVPESVFEVADLIISPSLPLSGEEVTISARVRNSSSEIEIYPARLWINGTIHESKAVMVGPSGIAPVEFTVNLPAGSYDVRIDRLMDSLTVSQQAAPTPTSTPAATPTPVEAASTPPPVAVVATSTPRPGAMATPRPAASPMVAAPAPTATVRPATPTPVSVLPPSQEDGGIAVFAIFIGIVVAVGAAGAGAYLYLRRKLPSS